MAKQKMVAKKATKVQEAKASKEKAQTPAKKVVRARKTLVDGITTTDVKWKGKECKLYRVVENGKSVLEAIINEQKVNVYSATAIKSLGEGKKSKKADEPRPYQYHTTLNLFNEKVKA